jgi:hypothetical protein
MVERELALPRKLIEREVVSVDGQFVSVRKIVGHPSGAIRGSAFAEKYGEPADA